jgi:hypothetical protein
MQHATLRELYLFARWVKPIPARMSIEQYRRTWSLDERINRLKQSGDWQSIIDRDERRRALDRTLFDSATN